MSKQLLTVKEVVPILQVSKDRVYELIKIKVIPVVRLGPRQIRIDPDVLDAFIRSGGITQGNGNNSHA